MRETIFIISRTTGGVTHESYVDYWNMVRLWGYRTCELSEVDYQNPEHTYIWTSPIGRPQQVFEHDAARARKCKLILWHLEWPNWVNGKLLHLDGLADPVDQVWVSDAHLLSLWRIHEPKTAPKVRFLVLGGHPDFGNPGYDSEAAPAYDFAHFMYLTGFRGEKFYAIAQRGFSMAPNTFDMGQRDAILRQSRWGLNLHQNPLPCLSPQRFMIFASYRLPIITDFCENPSPFRVFQDALIQFDPKKSSVMHKETREGAVDYNYRMITDTRSFRAEVDGLVEAL